LAGRKGYTRGKRTFLRDAVKENKGACLSINTPHHPHENTKKKNHHTQNPKHTPQHKTKKTKKEKKKKPKKPTPPELEKKTYTAA